MAVKYEISAVNTGGRKGHVATEDKAIDSPVIPPYACHCGFDRHFCCRLRIML